MHRVAHLLERPIVDGHACLTEQSDDPPRVEVGHRTHEEADLLVDDPEVVGEQHRHLHRAKHPLVVTRRGHGAGPEHPPPLGVVLPQVLGRLFAPE